MSPTLFGSPPIPALFRATSSVPKVLTTFWMAVFTSSNMDTSHSIKMALVFSFFISSIAISEIGDFKSAIAILAPSFAAAIAHALPMPDNPPVINTVLFSSFFIFWILIMNEDYLQFCKGCHYYSDTSYTILEIIYIIHTSDQKCLTRLKVRLIKPTGKAPPIVVFKIVPVNIIFMPAFMSWSDTSVFFLFHLRSIQAWCFGVKRKIPIACATGIWSRGERITYIIRWSWKKKWKFLNRRNIKLFTNLFA